MSDTLVREATPEASPVTERDVLVRAADLLEEFGWCRAYCAVDATGEDVSYTSPAAVAFCSYGALMRAASDFGGGQKDYNSAYEFLYEAVGDSPIGFNDYPGRTKAEVVAKLREAAQRCAK